MSPGRYSSYKELSEHEQEGRDYRIRLRTTQSPVAVLAPHGGRIEPGSCHIADMIAGSNHSFYTFQGCKSSGNRKLHIGSCSFDEPQALAMVAAAAIVLTVHGCRGTEPLALVGGRDHWRQAALILILNRAGFPAAMATTGLRGQHPDNLCNRGSTGLGVQLELSAALRQLLLSNPAGNGSENVANPLGHRFVAAVCQVLAKKAQDLKIS